MEKEQVTIDWGGTRGAVWTGAGALIGLLAQRSGLLGGNGLLGGGTSCEVATQRDLGYERELTKANAEIGQLKAEKYADSVTLAAERRLADKIEKIETTMQAGFRAQGEYNVANTAAVASISNQTAQLMKMTNLIISAPAFAESQAAAAPFIAKASATAASAGSGS